MIGIEPVVALGARWSGESMATLPGTKRVRRNAGAENHRARVVDWPGRDLAE